MAEPIKISCRDVWRVLSEYIENDVSPHQRKILDEHFRSCNHCSAVLDGTRNVIHLSCDDRSFTVPAGFSRRLEKRLLAALRKH